MGATSLHLRAFGRRQGRSLTHSLSKNGTHGDEDAALSWQEEGAGLLQLVPPGSDACSLREVNRLSKAWYPQAPGSHKSMLHR